MGEYVDFGKDFHDRTLKNLKIIEALSVPLRGEVFETTQLINSLLGLLIIPKERFWKEWKNEDFASEVKNMRDAVVHANIEQIVKGNEIVGFKLNNENWSKEYGIREIKEILRKIENFKFPKDETRNQRQK